MTIVRTAHTRLAYSMGMKAAIVRYFLHVLALSDKVGVFAQLIIRVRIWVLRHIERLDDEHAFLLVFREDGCIEIGDGYVRKRQFIAHLFGKSLCPTCKSRGYL